MNLITRAKWRARQPSGGRNNINAVPLGTAIHWHGGGIADELRTHDDCYQAMRDVQASHMDGRGWSDFAYSLAVCPHGDVFEGRGKGVGTAANGTSYGNANYYAVLALWGKGDGAVPTKMLDGIGDAVALTQAWGAGDEVTKHRALFATECPGDELAGYVDAGRFSGGHSGGAQDVPFTPPKSEPSGGGFTPLWRIPSGLMSVEKVQKVVGVVADGLYGRNTKAAVARYQRTLGVAADGKWGRDTEAAHKAKGRKARGVKGLLQQGSKGSRVRRLQRGLNNNFPLYASLSVDGIFGAATERAVKEFQRRSGLAPDGMVGPKTRKALRKYGIKA